MAGSIAFYENTAQLLAHRMRCVACYRGVVAAWPGGVVPVGTAARMLGLSRQRFARLIAEGRVPVFTMPTGSDADRLVPVDFLLGLANPLDSGRGSGHHLPETEHRKGSTPKNVFAESTAAAQKALADNKKATIPSKISRVPILLSAKDLGHKDR